VPSSNGVIDFALHPPVGVMGDHLDQNGPYSGIHTLTSWNNAGSVSGVNDTFGITVQLNGPIPPHLGQVAGWVSADGQYDYTTYKQRLFQVVPQYQNVNGIWISDQVVDGFYFPLTFFWIAALPGRIGFYALPGTSWDLFYWLVG